MKFTDHIVDTANIIRGKIQRHPKLPTVDHGESVAILLWWSFLQDHAEHQGVPVDRLAREQLEAFIAYAEQHVNMIRTTQ